MATHPFGPASPHISQTAQPIDRLLIERTPLSRGLGRDGGTVCCDVPHRISIEERAFEELEERRTGQVARDGHAERLQDRRGDARLRSTNRAIRLNRAATSGYSRTCLFCGHASGLGDDDHELVGGRRQERRDQSIERHVVRLQRVQPGAERGCAEAILIRSKQSMLRDVESR